MTENRVETERDTHKAPSGRRRERVGNGLKQVERTVQKRYNILAMYAREGDGA